MQKIRNVYFSKPCAPFSVEGGINYYLLPRIDVRQEVVEVPYIPSETNGVKDQIRAEVENVCQIERVADYLASMSLKDFVGVLNYLINVFSKRWLNKNGLSYFHLSSISGTIGESQAEFRRRFIVPYEEEKIKENGDF